MRLRRIDYAVRVVAARWEHARAPTDGSAHRSGGALTEWCRPEFWGDHVALHAHVPAPDATWLGSPAFFMTITELGNAHSIRSPRDSQERLIVKPVLVLFSFVILFWFLLSSARCFSLFFLSASFSFEVGGFRYQHADNESSVLLYAIMKLSFISYRQLSNKTGRCQPQSNHFLTQLSLIPVYSDC